MDLWGTLGDVVILLGACLVFGAMFSRRGQTPLVGYLLAGTVLGAPGSLHVVQSQGQIEAIAELGVTMLLFSLGLEFSIQRVRKLGVKPLLGGVAQVLATTAAGAACSWAVGVPLRESIAVGIMISLSSTAVVLHMLNERAELEMPHGRNSLAVLLTQDMAVVPLALLMTLLAGGDSPLEVLLDAGRLTLMAVALVAALFLLDRVAVRALGTLTLVRNRELAVIFAVMTGLGSAWAAHAVGVSPALGAFIAGMFLGSSAFATQIRADISSLRVVLLTLFFGAVGMVADPLWILKNWHIVLAATALLTAGKLIIIWAIFRILGHTSRVSAATGLCLAQIGEFAFVLGSIGRNNGVVSAEVYGLVVSVTIISFFLSAVLVPAAPRFGDFIARRWSESGPGETEERRSKPAPEVVFVGFGPTGQIAARPFEGLDRRITVIDLNRDGVRRAKLLGFEGEIGDATQNEVLEHVQLGQAKVVVITVPHFGTASRILELVRYQAPHALVLIRSRYHMHSEDFACAGADVVIGDEEKVGESLAAELDVWLNSFEEHA